MAIVEKRNIIERVNKLLGENSDDEALSLLEDITDTLQEMSNDSLQVEITKLKTEMKELEETWRKKYRERFLFSDKEEIAEEKPTNNEVETVNSEITVDDLFTEGV